MERPVTLHIKNMVCPRCERVVREELEKLGLEVRHVELGEAQVFPKAGGEVEQEAVRVALEQAGFELLEDQKAKLVERIKTLIVDLIHHHPEELRVNYSDYIAAQIDRDYHYLSQLFSSLENVTIEKYIILQKIEKVKELLVYGELTLSEIAYQLHYSSVAHLSNQFKQVTGFTPTEFKKLKSHQRKGLDKIV